MVNVSGEIDLGAVAARVVAAHQGLCEIVHGTDIGGLLMDSEAGGPSNHQAGIGMALEQASVGTKQLKDPFFLG